MSSPPPPYNYQYITSVEGRDAVWDRTEDAAVVTGLHVNYREMLATTIHEAVPEHRYQVPGSSIVPLILAIVTAGGLTCFMFTPWAIPIGLALTFLVLLAWFWSNSSSHRPPHAPLSDNPVSRGRRRRNEGG